MKAAERLDEHGEIPREDVAHALAVIIDANNAVGREICLIGGETPVEEAIGAI